MDELLSRNASIRHKITVNGEQTCHLLISAYNH